MKKLAVLIACWCAKLNVFPALAVKSVIDGLRADIEHFCQLVGAYTWKQCTNFQHISFTEFVNSVFLSHVSLAMSASLPSRVLSIISDRPNKQVVRPDAWWVVAMMANHDPPRYRSMMYFPRNTVRQYLLINPRVVDSAVSALPGIGSVPQPAALRLLDIFPKPSYRRGELATA